MENTGSKSGAMLCSVCGDPFKKDRKGKGYNRRSVSCRLPNSEITVAQFLAEFVVEQEQVFNTL